MFTGSNDTLEVQVAPGYLATAQVPLIKSAPSISTGPLQASLLQCPESSD